MESRLSTFSTHERTTRRSKSVESMEIWRASSPHSHTYHTTAGPQNDPCFHLTVNFRPPFRKSVTQTHAVNAQKAAQTGRHFTYYFNRQVYCCTDCRFSWTPTNCSRLDKRSKMCVFTIQARAQIPLRRKGGDIHEQIQDDSLDLPQPKTLEHVALYNSLATVNHQPYRTGAFVPLCDIVPHLCPLVKTMPPKS